MASKNNKGKIKKPLGTTLGKASSQEDDIDLSHIQKPIHTSVHGLKEVFELFKNATNEVKNYITYDCDIMYECRICRTIFRSLANFILHKRSYCSERFSSIQHTDKDDFPEEVEEPCIIADCNPPEKKKTLHDVMNMLVEKQKNVIETKEEPNTVVLEAIEESRAAVFQTSFNKNVGDFMKSEVMEIHSILESDEAVLDASGKICRFPLKNHLQCSECSMNFLTKKTLESHKNYKHNKKQIVYVCPVCKDTFANAWSVYRHLYKVHRKTATQIRRLREQIHNSGIRKEEEPAKKRERLLLDKAESQWLNSVDCDVEVQMCEKCGKKFGRKAALQSHTQMCYQKAPNIPIQPKKKESEKSIRPVGSEESDSAEKKTITEEKSEETCDLNANNKIIQSESNSVAESVSDSDNDSQKSLSVSGKKKLACLDTESMLKIIGIESETETNNPTELSCDNKKQKHVPLILRRNSSVSSVKEIVELNSSNEEQPSTSSATSTTTDDVEEINESEDKSPDCQRDNETPKLEYGIDEYTHTNFIPKLLPYVDTNENLCIPCQRRCSSVKSLWLHMSKHFSWYRFQCSHCSFISFYKNDCSEHIVNEHQTKEVDESVQILPIPCWKIATMAHEFRAKHVKVLECDIKSNEVECRTDLQGEDDQIKIEPKDKDEEVETPPKKKRKQKVFRENNVKPLVCDMEEEECDVETDLQGEEDTMKIEPNEEDEEVVEAPPKKKRKPKVVTSVRPIRNRQVNRKYTQGDFLYDLGVLKLKEGKIVKKVPKKRNHPRILKAQKAPRAVSPAINEEEPPESVIEPTVVESTVVEETNYDSEGNTEEKTYSILMPMEFYPENNVEQ